MRRPRSVLHKLPVLIALFVLVTSPHDSGAQPYPVEASFTPLCIIPKMTEGSRLVPGGNRLVPFTGLEVVVDAPLPDVLATFPLKHQGRDRISVGMMALTPGLSLRFATPSVIDYFWTIGAIDFLPSPPWPAPLDSVVVSWRPWPGSQGGGNSTVFALECTFELHVTQPVLVTAEAVVNLVATYASPVDTIAVWGTEFGWPDHHLMAQKLAVVVAVEPATWGQVKHRARTLEREVHGNDDPKR